MTRFLCAVITASVFSTVVSNNLSSVSDMYTQIFAQNIKAISFNGKYEQNATDEILMPVSQIIDWAVEDVTGDNVPELLVLRKREDSDAGDYNQFDAVYGNGENESLLEENQMGAEGRMFIFGNELLICHYLSDYQTQAIEEINAGYIRLNKLFRMDFASARPLYIRIGDIEGDGVKEISICVYKPTIYHPVYAKRPFVYRYNKTENQLDPVWLGSRLSRPFDDYIFADINGDGIDELVSVETDRDGRKVMTCYYWWDFGFYKLGESPPYDSLHAIRSCDFSDVPFYSTEQTTVLIEALVEDKSLTNTVHFMYKENQDPDPSMDRGRLIKID